MVRQRHPPKPEKFLSRPSLERGKVKNSFPIQGQQQADNPVAQAAVPVVKEDRVMRGGNVVHGGNLIPSSTSKQGW